MTAREGYVVRPSMHCWLDALCVYGTRCASQSLSRKVLINNWENSVRQIEFPFLLGALREWLLEPDVWAQCHIVHGVRDRHADEPAQRYGSFCLALRRRGHTGKLVERRHRCTVHDLRSYHGLVRRPPCQGSYHKAGWEAGDKCVYFMSLGPGRQAWQEAPTATGVDVDRALASGRSI